MIHMMSSNRASGDKKTAEEGTITMEKELEANDYERHMSMKVDGIIVNLD